MELVAFEDLDCGSAVVFEGVLTICCVLGAAANVKALWKLRKMLACEISQESRSQIIPFFILSIVPSLAFYFIYGCSNHTTSHIESRISQGVTYYFSNFFSSLGSCKVKHHSATGLIIIPGIKTTGNLASAPGFLNSADCWYCQLREIGIFG